MNANRLRMIEEQQSGIARKVLEAVPIQERWTSRAIASEMLRSGHRADMKTIEGCLESLRDSGLIREPARGEFQRVLIPPAVEREELAAPEPKAVRFVKVEPLDRMATLTATLRERASQLLMLADEIDAAAISMEEERAAGTESDKKLRQLQSLLRDIGGAT